MNLWEKITILFWFLIAFLICFESSKLGIGTFAQPGPGFFPILLSMLLGFLSILLILKNRLGKEKPNEREKAKPFGSWNKIFWVLCALSFYGLFLNRLGFLLVTFLTMLFLYRKMGDHRWPFAFSASLLTTVTCYLVFQFWLSANLPKGMLGF
jgi:hypothetical protein